MLPALFLALALLPGPVAPQQEICENALDDDGDGLIDLNDPDCDCPVLEPASLIPNPSFEASNCCPQSRSELHCADTWIQASEATTDYLNSCGWMGWPNLPPPLPFPDGEACVGFRNGRFGDDDARPGWKEYAGACLLAPLRARTAYRFRFNVGFIDGTYSPPTQVVFYGSTDCSFLPFGIGDPDYGCPLNGEGWQRLGAVYVSGFNSWITTSIDVTPEENIYAIAIGPDCRDVIADTDIYYFFDNLVLDELRAFEFRISGDGNPCAADYALVVPDDNGLEYQWYYNGIAIIDAKEARLPMAGRPEGSYLVRILGDSECKVTQPYYHQAPVEESAFEQRFCPGDSYSFHGRALTAPGIYVDTLKSVDNCDSIVTLDLRLAAEFTDTVRARIFEGEQYPVGAYRYTRPGRYDVPLQSELGCDSLVFLDLSFYDVFFPNAFSPNNDGVNDRFAVFGGEELQQVVDLQVFDRWGALVYADRELAPNADADGWDGTVNGRLAPDGVYVYVATLLMDDGVERRRSGSLVLVR